MFSPGGGITQEDYYDAIRAGNPIHVEMYFSDQSITITEANIDISEGITITDILNGDSDLCFGKAVCKQLTARIVLDDSIRYVKWKDRFRLRFGVEINGSTSWVTIGYFNGVQPRNTHTASQMEYIAYDDMIKFEIDTLDFLDNLNYPISAEDLMTAIGTYVGVPVIYSEMEPYMVLEATYTETELNKFNTLREILAEFAEATGTYAKMHGTICEFYWFGDEQYNYGQPGYEPFPVLNRTDEFYVDHADVYYGKPWSFWEYRKWNTIQSYTWDQWCESYMYVNKINYLRVQYNDSSYRVAGSMSGSNPRGYIIKENVFTKVVTSSAAQGYVNWLYNKLQTFNGQLPMAVESVGNWLLESGDFVDVEIEQGAVIHMPLYYKTMHYNGSVTDVLETTGEMFDRHG